MEEKGIKTMTRERSEFPKEEFSGFGYV